MSEDSEIRHRCQLPYLPLVSNPESTLNVRRVVRRPITAQPSSVNLLDDSFSVMSRLSGVSDANPLPVTTVWLRSSVSNVSQPAR